MSITCPIVELDSIELESFLANKSEFLSTSCIDRINSTLRLTVMRDKRVVDAIEKFSTQYSTKSTNFKEKVLNGVVDTSSAIKPYLEKFYGKDIFNNSEPTSAGVGDSSSSTPPGGLGASSSSSSSSYRAQDTKLLNNYNGKVAVDILNNRKSRI